MQFLDENRGNAVFFFDFGRFWAKARGSDANLRTPNFDDSMKSIFRQNAVRFLVEIFRPSIAPKTFGHSMNLIFKGEMLFVFLQGFLDHQFHQKRIAIQRIYTGQNAACS